MTQYKLIYLIALFFCYGNTLADQCPTADIVKQREISRDYEWTINERKTLEDVLAVEKLYSVRIKNKGDFVACYYSGGKGLLRLDAKPKIADCVISQKSGVWKSIDAYEVLCKESDLTLCLFETYCNE